MAIAGIPVRVDAAFPDRLLHRTPRFLHVKTIVEPALANERPHLGEVAG
jgi:hypothetical protein